MENLQTRTEKAKSPKAKYSTDLKEAIVFLRHDEDKIRVRSNETVEIEIYSNGQLLFIGDKQELFDILKKEKQNQEYIEN
jgi:uncharacterized lipoprotein YbaY